MDQAWDLLADRMEVLLYKMTRRLRREGRLPAWNGTPEQQLVERVSEALDAYHRDTLKRMRAEQQPEGDVNEQTPSF